MSGKSVFSLGIATTRRGRRLRPRVASILDLFTSIGVLDSRKHQVLYQRSFDGWMGYVGLRPVGAHSRACPQLQAAHRQVVAEFAERTYVATVVVITPEWASSFRLMRVSSLRSLW